MNGNSDQSASMGRSDDEEEVIPMKQPASEGGEREEEENEDILDDDFLSFSNINGGSSSPSTERLAGRKRERSPSPAAATNSHDSGQYKNKPTIPWLNNNNTSAPQPPPPPQHQQQQWGRNNRGYGNHDNNNNYNSYNNKHAVSRTPPIVRLHNEIVSFVNLMSPTTEELQLRTKMVDRVTKLAHRIFGDTEKCQVLPFGSQVTGLCLPGSDIDFVIRFTDTKNNDGKKHNAKGEDEDDDEDFATPSNPLRQFADAVRDEFGVRSEFAAAGGGNKSGDTDAASTDTGDEDDSEEHLSYLEVIEHTRVPLVKFTVAPYNIDIDVCFDQPNGPESAELMHRFMESMPPLRPLTFVLKYFLASRDINRPFTGGIGSYLLQMMIVSFLQHRVRDDMARDCGSSGRHFNLGSLLLDFLEFYGIDFNYVTTGISVRHDGYYFPKGQREMKDVFWQPSRQFVLAMENPLDPKMDVGAGAFRMQMIKRIFEHAYKTLLAYVSEPIEPTDSILAMIIPPTEEMEKRMALKKDDSLKQLKQAEAILNGNVAPTPTKPTDRENNQKKKAQKKEKAAARKKAVKDKRKDHKATRKEKRRDSGGGNSNNGKKTNSLPFHLRG